MLNRLLLHNLSRACWPPSGKLVLQNWSTFCFITHWHKTNAVFTDSIFSSESWRPLMTEGNHGQGKGEKQRKIQRLKVMNYKCEASHACELNWKHLIDCRGVWVQKVVCLYVPLQWNGHLFSMSTCLRPMTAGTGTSWIPYDPEFRISGYWK